MAFDDVSVDPGQLQDSSQTAKNGSIMTTGLIEDFSSAVSNLVDALLTVKMLWNVAGSIEIFQVEMTDTLACFGTGLQIMDNGLAIAAQAFKDVDAALARTFLTVEKQLTYYTGYDPNTSTSAAFVPTDSSALATKTFAWQAPSPGFRDSVGQDTSGWWGATTSFVSQNWEPILAAGAVGGIIAAGAMLAPYTLGESSAAATGTAALVAAAAQHEPH